MIDPNMIYQSNFFQHGEKRIEVLIPLKEDTVGEIKPLFRVQAGARAQFASNMPPQVLTFFFFIDAVDIVNAFAKYEAAHNAAAQKAVEEYGAKLEAEKKKLSAPKLIVQ